MYRNPCAVGGSVSSAVDYAVIAVSEMDLVSVNVMLSRFDKHKRFKAEVD